MHSRRHFLARALGAAVVLAAGGAACSTTTSDAVAAQGPIKGATAITQVFGDGLKLTAVAVEYDRDVDTAKLSTSTFAVDGRTVTRVYANSLPTPGGQGVNGRYAIVELSPTDQAAALWSSGGGLSGSRKPANATIIQRQNVTTVDGAVYPSTPTAIATSAVKNLIVDDFRQFQYKDARTGETLAYNLYTPAGYDKNKSYPLVLFMHDATATSADATTTLVQGLGAVCWASPSDQSKHPAFVLAPQYSTQIVNDSYQASDMLDTTVGLIDDLTTRYNIDKNRLYTTGQSGGGMMSLAIDIKYPDLFAASFIVAGQWDPAQAAALARQRLWILVSEGDAKAYPTENAITAVLQAQGVKVSRATWNGKASVAELDAAAQRVIAEGSPINYVTMLKGTVLSSGDADNDVNEHLDTWRIAYTIDAIRDWVLQQRK